MNRTSEPVFHEEQKFREGRVWTVLATVPVIFLLLVVWQVVLGHRWGRHSMSNASVVGWTIFLWLIYWRLINVKLVTDVWPDKLSISMRGLWRLRNVPWTEITGAEVVRFDAAKDFGGYGIRFTRKGKAYIAGGDQGLRLRLTRGGTLVVGSQRVTELANIITSFVQRSLV